MTAEFPADSASAEATHRPLAATGEARPDDGLPPLPVRPDGGQLDDSLTLHVFTPCQQGRSSASPSGLVCVCPIGATCGRPLSEGSNR